MKRILTGAAAMRREDRLQQRENRLSIKNADLKAEVERLRKELIGVVAVLSAEVDFIATLTAENEVISQRLSEAIVHMKAQAVELEGWDNIDGEWPEYITLAEAALQPKEGNP